MKAVEIQQAGMQSTVGRDCRERLPTRRANDWIAEKRSPVICVARSRVCRDGRGMKGCPSSCHQHAHGVTVYPYREKLDEWWRGAQVQSIGC